MNLKTFVLILAAAVAACSSSTTPEGRSDALLANGPVELTLRAGQETQVGGSVLRVGFNRVLSDSRCPINAVCVWEGDAEVELALTMGTGPTVPHVVHTTLEPKTAAVGGFTITLLEVQPAPHTEVSIDPGAYTIEIRVEG